jgi:hypothetical protein
MDLAGPGTLREVHMALSFGNKTGSARAINLIEDPAS